MCKCPQWLPIIGNTSLLRNETKKYGRQIDVFRVWKKLYNSSIIGLKLGRELVVVALDYSLIHKVHTSNEYDGRPDNFFLRLRTMGSRLGITCTDGEIWSEQRNFVSRHLRKTGYGRNAMEELIQHEMKDLIQVIDEFNEQPVCSGNIVSIGVLNVLWTFTAGKKISNNENLTHLLDLMRQRSKAFDMSGGWLNTIPFLRFIAPERTSFNLIKHFNAELCNFFKPIIEEHKREFSADRIDEDLVFAFINEMKRNEGVPSNFTDTQLIMVILDLFIAGSQSTSNTIDFILMSLVLNKDIQKKCHEEIDAVLSADDIPSLKDKPKLSYIEAVILETQRYYNIVPVSGPRRVLNDTELGGFHLPKNTTVLIGLETIHMDTEYWGDPDVFRPERFLDFDRKIVNTERFVAFGQGRRKCLGEALARASLFIFTVGILQKFSLEIPLNGKLPEKRTQAGLLTTPTPYKIVFKHR
ncbi:probable cytochrome P450 305a1 isoform X2 [Contarinia nasturtii]|uniref:probable cytochrome P450 305a1 isoform X2 n=1 Tax=Contarinia nasturtii TaxID=265458 RepID=UPI0012D3B92B|nr:probable cytochrome P450 305a1 isoform X2 [Contarinia nasturtii]